MEKYKVCVWFTATEVIVSAKNPTEAKKKAYARLKKKSALSFVIKKDTDVY